MTKSFKTERPQIQQLKNLAQSNIITITLGGNDIGFAGILQQCFIANCVSDARSAEFNITRRNGLTDALAAAYGKIKAARPNARLVVVGYPNIFPTEQSRAINCGWLTDRERPALVHLAGVLDAGLAKAAQKAGAEYVSTLNVMYGHEECTTNSWMYPIGKRPLQLDGHPLADGQAAMAQAVFNYLKYND